MARGLALMVACACGARTELDGAVHDAGTAEASPPPPQCDFGALVADSFGATRWWNGGASLPAGHYRVTYADGCWKYASSQAWTVNAYATGPDTLWIVTGNATSIAPAPGTVGFYEGQGAYASFDACVNANLGIAPSYEFDFAGGRLGLWLADDPYADNVPGDAGRNPTYRLSSCP